MAHITKPTVGGSSGTWGTELNAVIDQLHADDDAIKATADAALPLNGGVMTGQVEMKSQRYATVDKGSITGTEHFDAAADFFFGTVTGDVTFTFGGWPASGKVRFVTVELTNAGAHTITWPAAVKWDGGSVPVFQSNGVDTIVFYTRDSGTVIRAALAVSTPA